MSKKLKKLPIHKTDKEAEDFVDNADLSEYDLSGFKPLSSFEFAQKKDARLQTRIASDQLKLLKAEAEKQNIPYTRLARLLIEQGIRNMQSIDSHLRH